MQGYSRMLTKFPPCRISAAREPVDDAPEPCGRGTPGAGASAHNGEAAVEGDGGNALQEADRDAPPQDAAPGTDALPQGAAAEPPVHRRIHSHAQRLRHSLLRLQQTAHRLH